MIILSQVKRAGFPWRMCESHISSGIYCSAKHASQQWLACQTCQSVTMDSNFAIFSQIQKEVPSLACQRYAGHLKYSTLPKNNCYLYLNMDCVRKLREVINRVVITSLINSITLFL